MPSQPKLRIFAGPNGSGKTTLYNHIKSEYFSTKLFVNADHLEYSFNQVKFIDLSEFSLKGNDMDFTSFARISGLFHKAGFNEETWNLTIRENVIVECDNSIATPFNSYHFAIVADFIRHELIKNRVSFSFESVFSHPSKLDLIDLAHSSGYKVYLYFIGTETSNMNLERVKDRVKKGGHAVDGEKVQKRYELTMGLLGEMIKKADITYLWDNSGIRHKFIGMIKNRFIELELSTIPEWIGNFVIDKLKN